jgi:F-type H+-transporting ATPase subunit a
MTLTPDRLIVLQIGPLALNATILVTWLVMALIVMLSVLATRKLSANLVPTRWQLLLETLVSEMQRQIRDVSQHDPGRYLAFVGTLFIFIATCNFLTIVPGYIPPTASLSTTTALALSVLVAVPLYGIAERGIPDYFRAYARPTILMLPFNIIGEISRTIALAIRLYGNVMSGTIIVGILISIAPFLFPIVLTLLGLLTGLVQAYIFAVLAMVYIASATRASPGGRTGHANRASTSRSHLRKDA